MPQSVHPTTVTLVAAPPPVAPGGRYLPGEAEDPFLSGALRTLTAKKAPRHRIAKVASVRDIDLELSKLTVGHRGERVRIQIVGHTLSGGLALGARWIPDAEIQAKAFKFPYYILDTSPSALGLLSKHAGKISELMLVGCNVGSASANGHPINGRTLTYTLAELLACDVIGADDVIGPEEFDEQGWYAPNANRRSPKGWRWVDAAPPVWTDAGKPRPRVKVA